MAKVAKHIDTITGTAYFACASYGLPFITVNDKKKYRVRENVVGIKSFWLDIDCGEGKDYPSQEEALFALYEFLAETKLPTPLIVKSGNGLHCYWVGETLSPLMWQPIADMLKEVCFAYSLKIDGKCTSDACRVLRPVGTYHRKGAPKLVEVHGAVPDRVGVVAFAKQLRALCAARGVSAVRRVSASVDNEFAIAREYDPSSAHEIRKHCGQVAAFADARGYVPEPLWFNMLGLLKHTTEGEAICQEWSSGHPSYDVGATQAKIVQWSKGPASCDSIRAANPAGCEGCQFRGKITSPIRLGVALPPPDPPEKEPIPATEDATSTGIVFDPKAPDFSLFANRYAVHRGKLCVVGESAAGIAEWKPISATIMWPASYHRDAKGSFKMVWNAYTNGKTEQFELSGVAIGVGGRDLFAELGERGIIANGSGRKDMETYIKDWFDVVKRKAEETKVYAQFGWQKDKSFVLGNRQYRPDGTAINVRLAGDAAQPAYAEAFSPRGSLEAWVSIVDRAYNYRGQEQYQFMLAAGFGAPLLRLFENYGGLTINAFSPEKGLGKSTAGKLAMGIWGDPKLLIRTKQQTTYKAYIAHCGVMNSLPVMMDEATNIDPRELSDTLYTFSQGTPRMMLDRTGRMNTPQQSWSTIQLSTANRSMVSLVGAMKTNADAEMGRIFEYQFGKVSTLTKEDADEILGEAERVYGAAGEVYVRYIVSHYDEVEAMLHETRRKLDRRIQLTVQDRFVSVGLACVVVGAVIAKNLGLIGFDVESLVDWMVGQTRNFKDAVVSNTPPILDVFGRMLTDITKGFIVTSTEGDTKVRGREATVITHPSQPKITGRLIEDQRILYIQQVSIRDWCVRNQTDYGEMQRAVVAAGWTTPEAEYYNIGKGTREYGLASTRCWKIDLDRMQGNSDVNRVMYPAAAIAAIK